MDVVFTHCAGLDVHKKRITACRVSPDPTGQEADGLMDVQDFGTLTPMGKLPPPAVRLEKALPFQR